MRSADSGKTRIRANSGLPATYSLTFAANPRDSRTLYAGAFEGRLFMSHDSGGSWSEGSSRVSNCDIKTLAVDPTHPNTIYAGTGTSVWATFRNGVSRSLFCGHTPHAFDHDVTNWTAEMDR
jgi:hypothetical protein